MRATVTIEKDMLDELLKGAINKRCGKSKEGGVSFHWEKRSKRRKETPPWRRVAFQKD